MIAASILFLYAVYRAMGLPHDEAKTLSFIGTIVITIVFVIVDKTCKTSKTDKS